jgi:hypothetical protein
MAALSLFLWLFMAAAETVTPLHAWMHGGKIADNDDCAVIALAHGQVNSVDCDLPHFTPLTRVEITPRLAITWVCFHTIHLPDGRAPPALLSVS